ncbi:hypothetical protein IMZ48_31120 [Candidatus Bathyarchaeota archaeon]|nr:hypothetical protein [Candidatus Bathyarchaeota archaeon]
MNGLQARRSLSTDSERITRDKVRQIEHELPTGNLPETSRLPLPTLLDAFCGHLRTQQTHNSYRKDVSRLRNVFGEVCEDLKIRPPGSLNRRRAKLWPDKYAGDHVQARFLEDVTPVVISVSPSKGLGHYGRMPRKDGDPLVTQIARITAHHRTQTPIKTHVLASPRPHP